MYKNLKYFFEFCRNKIVIQYVEEYKVSIEKMPFGVMM